MLSCKLVHRYRFLNTMSKLITFSTFSAFTITTLHVAMFTIVMFYWDRCFK